MRCDSWNYRKILDLILILVCLIFITLGMYGYYLKKISFQDFILGTLGFGAGLIISIIYFTTKHKDWFISSDHLTKKQNILMSIAGFAFAIGSLGVAITANLHIILRLALIGGFLFFGTGSIILLIRNKKS